MKPLGATEHCERTAEGKWGWGRGVKMGKEEEGWGGEGEGRLVIRSCNVSTCQRMAQWLVYLTG